MIKVEQQLKKTGKRFELTDRLKSTHSYRQLYASAGILKLLKKHKWVRDEQKKIVGDAYEDHNLVFCWEDGKPIDPNLVTKWFRETAQKIGLKGRGLHSCRHTFVRIPVRIDHSFRKQPITFSVLIRSPVPELIDH